MQQSTVSVRGQTVIPKEIRDELGIKAKSRLAWSSRDGVMTVVPIPENPIEGSFGVLAGKGYKLEDFLEERGKERALERKRSLRDDAHIQRAIGKRKREE